MLNGTLLYIPNYVFENGEYKNKYFLILKEIHGVTLIVSLPSSIEYFPTDTQIEHGCIDLVKAQQTTYCFKSGYIVDSNNGFSFPKNTYLHGCWLKEIDKTSFFQTYPIQGFHYEIKAVLDTNELENVIKCFKNSSSVKNRIKRLL
jgi:hypothetical protein